MPDNLPIFLYDRPNPDGTSFHIYGAPSIDGYTVKFSSSMFSDTLFEHPSQINQTLTDDQLQEFGQRVAEVVPDFYPDVARLTMHHDGFTADGHAIIDTDPATGITMAVGMSGTGMKFAPYFGQLAAQLAITGDTSLRPEFFALASHTPAE